MRVFSEVPEPSSTSVSALVSSATSRACVEQDRAFGAGRVVLGESGDLVEQLAAPVVVEPLRRERLRRGAEAGAHVGFQRARRGVGREVHVDGDVGGHADPFRVASISTPSAVSTTTEWSGTSVHPGSSSTGSETITGPRCTSELPTRVRVDVRAVGQQEVEAPGRDREHVVHHARRARRSGATPSSRRCEHEREEHLGVGVADERRQPVGVDPRPQLVADRRRGTRARCR